ncbi:penicillin acylase family protein [Paraburkholderia humisilvae]|uniref:Aculeacin-A acylase n=1 Tax=Paraburkholderia humisilvae TaxID=627669 RepID=A0A6J5F2I1_9BURK|nr:penicillin acylase family protein [Paraburkholderia humisilvae]CAB3771782.1 Aculeacin-A acylase [Paraburkholderia humisilvae]
MAYSFRVVSAVSLFIIVAVPTALNACSGSSIDVASTAQVTAYRADIRRTQDGIPHIKAGDWGSLGYGYGYAQAQDDLCTLADGFTTWRGERSAYFGADARPMSAATFGRPRNLDLDFFIHFTVDDAAVARFRATQSAQLRNLVTGFADGYNRYIDDLNRGRFPGAHTECAGKPWVKPVSADDLYRRLISANLAGGAMHFIEGMVHARPPVAAPTVTTGMLPPRLWSDANVHGTAAGNLVAVRSGDESQGDVARLAVGGHAGIGSNAFAFGGASTHDGHSLLFGNPHWFWRGPDRLYQAQLTIPGQIDVAGASFLASPVIMLGFNRDIAWTHTTSSARRFGLFELKLVPEAPTRYVYDGREETLDAVPVTVQVRDPATGELEPVTRVLYRSRFGPIVDLSSMSPALGWSAMHAFALRDVNADNTRAFENFLAWGQARSLDDFIAIQKRLVAMPWVNTFAIGRNDPRVWFADIGAMPDVPDTLAAACTTPMGHALDVRMPGVPVLDGSRSACMWPGNGSLGDTLPVAAMPSLLRHDYVGNFNGSYWLTNPQAPLTGFAQITGQTSEPQSLRTRLGHALAAQLMAQPGGITRDALERTVLSSTSMSEQLFRQPLLDGLCAPGTSAQATQSVDLGEACNVLRTWDGVANIGSRGANLWGQFWRHAQDIPAAQLYTVPFDPARPLTTPAGLNTANPAISEALGAAVVDMRNNGFALDSTRGELLYTQRGSVRIPLYGGCDPEGYFTVACAQHPLTRQGYPLEADAHANSYVQVVSFGTDGPEADTLLSYSESDDPASPHFSDATLSYSKKAWARFPFTEQAIHEAPGVKQTTLSGPRTGR